MAPRLKKFHQDEIRQKIQTSQLINRLQDYALGKLDENDITPQRIKAIEVLLKKALPDLSSVQVSGDKDEPLTINIVKHGDNNASE